MAFRKRREALRLILTGSVCIRPGSVYDATSIRIAQDLGFAVGMFGGSVASLAVLGDPDIALITLTELAEQMRRMSRAAALPVLVDADHGYGNALNVRRTVEELETAGAAGLPWYAILCPPILFAAGMSLLDSIDGSFMNFAYGWAFSKPVRKVFYNITITGLSVAVALVIGTVELGGLIAQHLDLSGSFWNWFENININLLGFLIVGMFVGTWVIALAIWRLGRIEERWSAHLTEP